MIKLLILIIVMIIFHYYFKNYEGFNEQYSYPGYCSSCNLNDRLGCSNCVNCGYCITPSGYGECVQGDQNGPYFRADCVAYRYQEPISYFGYWPNQFYNWVGRINPYYYAWPNYYNNGPYYNEGSYYEGGKGKGKRRRRRRRYNEQQNKPIDRETHIKEYRKPNKVSNNPKHPVNISAVSRPQKQQLVGSESI